MQNIEVGPVSVAFFINKIRPAFKKGKRTIQLQVRRRPSKGLKKIEVKKCTCLCTLISLINVKSRLLILKKNPPSTFIDFLDFFPPSTPRLLQVCTSFFQKIPSSTVIREMRVDENQYCKNFKKSSFEIKFKQFLGLARVVISKLQTSNWIGTAWLGSILGICLFNVNLKPNYFKKQCSLSSFLLT